MKKNWIITLGILMIMHFGLWGDSLRAADIQAQLGDDAGVDAFSVLGNTTGEQAYINSVGTMFMKGFQLGTSTTAGYVLTANPSGVGTWANRVNPNLIVLEDDFMSGLLTTGNIGNLSWVLGAGAVTVKAGESSHPGMLTLSSSAVSAIIGRLLLANATATVNSILPADVDYMALIVRPLSGTATMSVRFGLITTPATSGEGAQGIYWSFLPATSANWRTVTRDGVGITSNSTAVAYATGTWNFLELKRNGSNWEFWRNGVLQFTHSTNIPTAAEIPIIAIETNEAVAKTMDVDYFGMRSITISARY